MGWFGPSKDDVYANRARRPVAKSSTAASGSERKSRCTPAPGPSRSTSSLLSRAVRAAVTYTRMRAPYVNPDGFRFTIYRKGFFSNLGEFLGIQDIEVGDPEFDEVFIIKGNDESKVVNLFADKNVRRVIQAQPKIYLQVKDSEGWFGPKFPENVDELHFQVVGVVKDIARLKALFDLFAVVLDQLCRIGSAYKEESGVEL